tara:strand:- start:74 stop:781 length:708 start_codon:yes stop_codon:yes gene_type:complete
MALPKLNTPTYELELPSTGEILKYRPFLVKEQKLLLIAQESGEEKQIANAMGELVNSCTFGKVNAKSAPMFDIEYLFLRIRGKSVGEKVKLNLICPDDGKTTVPYELNLEDVECQVQDDHSNEIQINEDIKIVFRYPLLNDLQNVKASAGDSEKTFHFLECCIDSIHSGDDVFQRIDIKDKEISDFIEQFTNEQFEKITQFFNTMPKLRHVVKVTNPKTKKKNEILLEGLESFLG